MASNNLLDLLARKLVGRIADLPEVGAATKSQAQDLEDRALHVLEDLYDLERDWDDFYAELEAHWTAQERKAAGL